jgi:hypothetical protein
MRPLLPFGAPKVLAARLVLRSSSPGLNAYSDGGSHGVPLDPRPLPASAPNS